MYFVCLLVLKVSIYSDPSNFRTVSVKYHISSASMDEFESNNVNYTLSHLENDRDISRIPEEDTCHRARNFCVFSSVQKGTPGLTQKGCALQRVSSCVLNDVTVVLGMRQSIDKVTFRTSASLKPLSWILKVAQHYQCVKYLLVLHHKMLCCCCDK